MSDTVKPEDAGKQLEIIPTITPPPVEALVAEVTPDTNKKLKVPDVLRTICSVSCAVSASEFFGMLKAAGVTMLLDTRLSPSYDGARFADGRDLPYLCQVHQIEYWHATIFSPTHDMRRNLDETFKSVKRSSDRDPNAWTRFLENYEVLMRERQPLKNEEVRKVIYGKHAAIAVMCACRHHDDCHRSMTTGILTKFIDGVSLKMLYPEGKELPRVSPRRYRLHDFPNAGLVADLPKTKKAVQ